MTVGQSVAIRPGDGVGKIDEITINDEPVGAAKCGENVKIKVKGVSEDQVAKGPPQDFCGTAHFFPGSERAVFAQARLRPPDHSF